jgi:hypothetical protein
MPFKRRGARTPSPDPTTLWAVLQEDLFMSESSVKEERKKSRFGKKEKVETETGTRESGNQPAAPADEREEVEAERGRKKGKDRRQQFEGPQAKVVFHHFTADSAEDVLKVEGESTAPSLNSELDALIKVEV